MNTHSKAAYVAWGIVIVSTAMLLFTTGCSGNGTATPLPIPTPAGEPFTPVGKPDSRLGFTWISSFYANELAQNAAPDGKPRREQDAARAGATWDRLEFRRAEGDDGEGVIKVGSEFVFDHGTNINYTNAVQQDKAHGLQILAVINGPVPAPSSPDMSEWRSYVEAIVEAFGSDIDAWEIGSEALLPQQPGLSPENYVEILRTTCEVLYEKGQENKLILLGSPDSPVSLRIGDTSYWQDVWELIGGDGSEKNYGYLKDCLDGAGVHVYGRPVFSYEAIEDNVVPFEEDGWRPRGIWITEHGVMWGKEVEGGFPYTNKYRQASYVVQQYVLALAGFAEAGIDVNDPNRAMTFYHRFADACGESCGRKRDNNWGLMDFNRSDPHYPSYDAMSLVTFLFSGASAPEDMTPAQGHNARGGDTVEHYRFDVNGQYIHALWAIDKAVRSYKVPAERTDANKCATLYYQPGDGSESDGYDGRFWSASISRNASGEFVLDLPASKEPERGQEGDPYRGTPMIGGPVYIIVETNEACPWWSTEGGGQSGSSYGIRLIRSTLARSGINVTDDPPIPGMLFSTVPYPPPPDVAWRLLNVPATYSDTHLAASLVVSHTVLSGTFGAEWTTDAWIGAQFITLTVPWAQVYEKQVCPPVLNIEGTG